LQGIEYYEKNVTNQLIEFMNYYISETVQEAKLYRDYAKKSQIEVSDVRLALTAK
jgi:histone H3/H4